jgi:hypothetical protein
VTGYGLDGRVRFPKGARDGFLLHNIHTSSGPFQSNVHLLPGDLPLGVKRPGNEADTHLHLLARSSTGTTLLPAYLVKLAYNVTQCNLIQICRCFGGTYCLYLHDQRASRPKRASSSNTRILNCGRLTPDYTVSLLGRQPQPRISQISHYINNVMLLRNEPT